MAVTPPSFLSLKHTFRQISHKKIFTAVGALWTLFMVLLWIHWNHVEVRWASLCPPLMGNTTLPLLDDDLIYVNWAEFAYVQYATSIDYLCNSVMIFEQLHHLETKPGKLLLYPEEWGLPIEKKTKLQAIRNNPEIKNQLNWTFCRKLETYIMSLSSQCHWLSLNQIRKLGLPALQSYRFSVKLNISGCL